MLSYIIVQNHEDFILDKSLDFYRYFLILSRLFRKLLRKIPLAYKDVIKEEI